MNDIANKHDLEIHLQTLFALLRNAYQQRNTVAARFMRGQLVGLAPVRALDSFESDLCAKYGALPATASEIGLQAVASAVAPVTPAAPNAPPKPRQGDDGLSVIATAPSKPKLPSGGAAVAIPW